MGNCPYCYGTGWRGNNSYLLYRSGRKFQRVNGKKVRCYNCKGTGSLTG